MRYEDLYTGNLFAYFHICDIADFEKQNAIFPIFIISVPLLKTWIVADVTKYVCIMKDKLMYHMSDIGFTTFTITT